MSWEAVKEVAYFLSSLTIYDEVQKNSLAWERQWNGNPQSDFCWRFFWVFLRAWGSFISTSAVGI